MGDQAALQEAIQRARQLAAKITQNQPVKRPASSALDHSGPVKVTLAYEKPANSDNGPRHEHQSSRQRSSSRDYNRNERDPRDSRDSRGDSRERYSGGGGRDNYSRSSRDRDSSSHRDHSSTRLLPHIGSGGGGGGGGGGQPPYDGAAAGSGPMPPLAPSSMLGSRGSGGGGAGDEKIEIIIPCAVIGLVIGKGGENIKRIQNESGAAVRVDPNTVDEKGNKLCTITGTRDAVENARMQVENVIENAGTNKRPRMMQGGGGGVGGGAANDVGSESFRMKIPASRTGAIIGKGGETIKSIKSQSGCDIELDKSAKDCGPDESLFILRGSQDKINKARSLIEARLAQGRDGRDRGGGGGGGLGGGGGGGGPRDYPGDHQSGRGKGGVATGANAAPVGQYPDLPSSYPANPAAAAAAAAAAGVGPQGSADMTAAWAAYFAQYSTLYSQTGGPAAAAGGAPGMSFPGGQPGMMGGAMAPSQPMGQQLDQHQQQQQQPQIKTEPGAGAPGGGATGAGGAQDYSDQWIEYYLANGRPDYAEQIIQMKKQQQQQAPK